MTCGLFGAVSGSNTATAATIGTIAIPEMKKYGYDDSLSTASIAAGGALGVLIPPSVIFIVYGIATEQSIGQLFHLWDLARHSVNGFYVLTIMFLIWRKPELGPQGPKSTWGETLATLRGGLIEVFIIFMITLGGLYLGWFTPTEAGAVGACFSLGDLACGKENGLEGDQVSLTETTRTTAMIMFLLAGAIIFGQFMAVSRIPFEVAGLDSKSAPSPFCHYGAHYFDLFNLGFFIDALAMILLTIPVFYPMVTALIMIRSGLA